MAVPSVAALATMALLNPAQHDLLVRETRQLERAVGGQPMPFDGMGDSAGDLGTAGMSLFERGERESGAVPLPDPGILRDMLARNQETLAKGTPPTFSPFEKNRLWQMAKDLREVIRTGMISHDQLERPTQANVDALLRHEERTVHAQLALRNIMRILDPRDETVVVETLRPTTPSYVNWTDYYGNFDQLYMTDKAELEREITVLDDEIYARFMQLRLKGVETPKLLMRTLGISQGVYEACKLRLERDLEAIALADETSESEEDAPQEEQRESTARSKGKGHNKDAIPVEDMSAFTTQ